MTDKEVQALAGCTVEVQTIAFTGWIDNATQGYLCGFERDPEDLDEIYYIFCLALNGESYWQVARASEIILLKPIDISLNISYPPKHRCLDYGLSTAVYFPPQEEETIYK